MADVVLKYPALKLSSIPGLPVCWAPLFKKCFTNVVDDGLNKKSSPEHCSSFSLPTPLCKL